VRDNERLLRLEHQAAVRIVHLDFEPRRNAIGVRRAEHVDAHHVLTGVVQEQRDDFKRHRGRQPPRKIAKQRREIAMRRHGVGHFDQRPQLIALTPELLAFGRIVRQDSHIVRG